MKKGEKTSYGHIEPYRGTLFQGQWPTIPECYEISVQRFPDKLAFSSYDPETLELTYAQGWKKILAVAAFLTKKGIKSGDKVMLTGKNSVEWAVAYLGILKLGAIVVPMDYQISIEKAQKLAAFAEVKWSFIDQEKWEDLPGKGGKGSKSALFPGGKDYILDLPEAGTWDQRGPSCEDTAAILFTSGTTGNEKGVMLSHKNFVSDVFMASHPDIMEIFSSDVFYALLPLHHSYTMTAVFLETIAHGASCVFAKKIVVKQMLEDLKKGGVTMFLGIPMLFNKLLKGILGKIRERGAFAYALVRFLMSLAGFFKKVFGWNAGRSFFGTILQKAHLDTNRICISGGGPLAPQTFKLFNQLGIDFVQGYGLTETAPILTLNPVKNFKESSVGMVLPGIDISIREPDEKGFGEIYAKGPNITSGYFHNPQATEELFSDDGYLKTGDVGYLDQQNYLFLTGRRKSLIVTEGGKNVFPEEIEDAFQLYTEIEQIMIKGYIKDQAQKIEGIEAWIYPAEEWRQGLTQQEAKETMVKILREVNKGLTSYQKIERYALLEEAMETTSTRKIRRPIVIKALEGRVETVKI